MNSHKAPQTLVLALAGSALAFCLSVTAQAQTTFKFLKQFDGTNGTNAISVIQATDGNFYGAGGSTNQGGEIFRMKPSGEITAIYTFCSKPNCADGEEPNTPILGSDGNLYGVTQLGGNKKDAGTFYRMTLNGHITTLYTFCSVAPCTEGYAPTGIIQASDGNFYGATYSGGAHGSGTLFELTPKGKLTVLHSFCSEKDCQDGHQPTYPPIQGIDGNFYGATYDGGTNHGGVIYQWSPSGAFQVIHNFCGQTDFNCETGSNPSFVVQDANGNLFGTTVYGGSSIFEITPTHEYRTVYSFTSDEGGNLTGIILASDGNLYGVTTGPGTTLLTGTVFSVTPAGVSTTLHSFYNTGGPTDVVFPVFQGTDGDFYGSTVYGPNISYGVMYRVSNGAGPLVETAPVAGPVGKSVLILGNNLTGTTSVTFNGVEATFTVKSDTYIKATVPTGATTGTVSVVTSSGTLNSNPQFVVTK